MASKKVSPRSPKSPAKAVKAKKGASSKKASPFRVLTISGPNLQLLGTREPEIYGTTTLAELHEELFEYAALQSVELDVMQTNHEGIICDAIADAVGKYDGILLNAAAYTHTSLAIFDALKATRVPCVEVHLSNPAAREAYRKESMIAPACVGVVSGFGKDSYILALAGLIRRLAQ